VVDAVRHNRVVTSHLITETQPASGILCLKNSYGRTMPRKIAMFVLTSNYTLNILYEAIEFSSQAQGCVDQLAISHI
jgi:hypothetical protein